MEFSQAEVIRDYVKELLAQNTDLSTSEKRSQAVELFLQKHADRKFNKKSVRTEFQRIALEEAPKFGKAKEDVGKMQKQTPKFRLNSDMESEISQAPQKLEHLKEGAKLAEGEAKKTIAETIVIFNEKDVAAAIAAFWLMIKMMFPTLELLTEEEKNSLGRLWLPAFHKYLTENWKILGIPLLATMGMLFPKIKKARDQKKKTKDEKTNQSDVDRAKKLTCPWCNKLFDADIVEAHKNECSVRKKYDK